MLIAHLPAGYLLARSIKAFAKSKALFAATIFGSFFPDFDMLWFHLIDNRQTHHHEYITHWPLFYLAIMGIAAVMLVFNKKLALLILAFATGAILHMVLDTIAAPMMWFEPFSDYKFEFVQIPATQPHWILSFVFHWTFLNELAICLGAVFLMYKFPNKAH